MKTGFLIVAAGLVTSAAHANPVLTYQNDFTRASQIGPEWITNPDWNSATNFGGFLGRFGRETHTLTFDAYRPGGPGDGGDNNDGGSDGGDQGGGDEPGGSGGGNSGGIGGGRSTIDYTLIFDLYLLDSWDGAYAGQYGPDYFGVSANDQSLLWEGWHSTQPQQNIIQPTVGPVNLGFNNRYLDSIFRDITLIFSVSPEEETIWIDFIGSTSTWHNLDDESWGIDNVRVYVATVPAPTSVALGSIGLLLASTRRRRSDAVA